MTSILDQTIFNRYEQSSNDLVLPLQTAIWGLNPAMTAQKAAMYLYHYDSIMNAIDTALVRPSTHKDVINLVKFVRERKTLPLKDIITQLIADEPEWLVDPTEAAARKALEYATRLWLMVSSDLWSPEETLCEYIRRLFPLQQPADHPELVPDELTLDAYDLVKIGGIALCWTDRLDDHLRLNPRSLELYIFRYATYLNPDKTHARLDIFPEGLLLETAATLALLFPQAGTSHRKWRNKKEKRADLDIEAKIGCNVSRNLNDYKFWHERLLILQSTYDKTRPSGLRQWFHDRRDADRFYTFWIAILAIILTLIFGLIQCITGILQVLQSH